MMDYYGLNANLEYMSCSQVKQFIGAPGIQKCEAKAVAELCGEYQRPASDALTFGSYIDVQLTGTQEEQAAFMEAHPDMFSSRGPTKGQLKAAYQKANDMIARVRQDADNGGVFLRYLDGDHQAVFTGEINGFAFKAKLDCLGDGWICDLKTCESITKKHYADGWWNFIDYWGYPLQGAIYQELVYQNTGKKLPFYIAAISKEPSPDIGIFRIPQECLDIAMRELDKETLTRIDALKRGEIEPERCEHCDYCRSTKVIKKPVNYLTIGEKNG
jgi:hypothetical protein